MSSKSQDKSAIPAKRCTRSGNHWHFDTPKYYGSYPWYWRNAYVGENSPDVGDEVYLRSGHKGAHPYKIDRRLESDFCIVKTQEGEVLRCKRENGSVESQLFQADVDFRRPPSYEQSVGDEKGK